MMNAILKFTRLKKIDELDRIRVIKTIDPYLMGNFYKTDNVISIIDNNKNLDFILDRWYLLLKLLKKSKKVWNKNDLFNVVHTYTGLENFRSKLNSTNSYWNNNNNWSLLRRILFNKIKYKNMGGLKLEVKGRITKRYRADRAQFKVKWKGGLKNIDSSFKGLSGVKYRGYINSNVNYSLHTSKRRIGAFAVKGWISGV